MFDNLHNKHLEYAKYFFTNLYWEVEDIMKKILGSLTLAGLLTVGIANAGTITTANADIEVSGALTAGYVATNNDVDPTTGLDNPTKDAFHITAADIDLKSKVNNTLGFFIDLGTTYQASVISNGLNNENRNFEIEIAYVSIRPIDNLTIDAGLLATNIGYELYHPYENGNILFGMVWNAQPVTYTGVRATFEAMPNLSVYAEYNQDSGDVFDDGGVLYTDAFAVGVLGSIMNIDFAVSYYDYEGYKNLVDIVLSTKFGMLDVGLNFDYQWLDDTTKNYIKNTANINDVEDSAYGLALYVTPNLTENISVPIRFEYIKDKDTVNPTNNTVVYSGIYGVGGDSAYSISVTPTWKPNKNSFVRAEIDYVKTDKNSEDIFGQNNDSRTIYAVEAGYIF
jgi:predicted transport protein